MENTQNIKDLIQKFYPYAKNALGFEHPVRVVMRHDAENAEESLGKTAYYDPEDKLIVLYVTSRHPKDILRSFSHELVHHAQNCRGDLDDMTTQGHYAKDGKGREIEEEAYLQGNLCLRDYEDQLKFEGESQMNEHYQIAKEELRKLVAEAYKAVLDEKTSAEKAEEEDSIVCKGDEKCLAIRKEVRDLERTAYEAERASTGNDMAAGIAQRDFAKATQLVNANRQYFPGNWRFKDEDEGDGRGLPQGRELTFRDLNESRKTLNTAYTTMVKSVKFNKNFSLTLAKMALEQARKKLDKLSGDLFGYGKEHFRLGQRGPGAMTFRYPNTPEQMQKDGRSLDPAKMQKYAEGVEKIKAELEKELRDIIEQDKKPAEYPVHKGGHGDRYPGHDDPDRGRNFDARGNRIQEGKQVVTETPQQPKEVKETNKTWYDTSLFNKLVSRWTNKGDK